MAYKKHAVALKIWVDTALGLKNTTYFEVTVCLPLQNIPYLFMMQGTLSGRCSTAWGQNEIPCHSKVLFPLVHACYKDMQHGSKHNPIIWARRNLATLNFLSDIHWFNTIKYFKEKNAVFWLIFTKLTCLSCLAGLLSGPCNFLLPDVQAWVWTVYTQDLKPTVLPQYIPISR